MSRHPVAATDVYADLGGREREREKGREERGRKGGKEGKRENGRRERGRERGKREEKVM